MPNIVECQARVATLLDAIVLVGVAQHRIDDKLVSAFSGVPEDCRPLLLQETESADASKCPISAGIGEINNAHRKFAKFVIRDVALEMREWSAGEWDEYARVAKELEGVADNIQESSEELTVVPGLAKVLSENVFRMLSIFNDCMQGQ